MKLTRRAGAALIAAVFAMSVLGAAPAQAKDTSWGGAGFSSPTQARDTSWGGAG